MSICSIESTSEKPPVNLGQRRCTWGPSYWCSSLSNTRECNSIDHCSDQIWSQQAIEKKENDNICKYCEVIIEKLRLVIHSETVC
jgi:saposin